MASTNASVDDNGTLSHAEIWDDSTLINAWDSALKEYKTYHSIKNTGTGDASESITNKSAGHEVEMQDASMISVPREEGGNSENEVDPGRLDEGEEKNVDEAKLTEGLEEKNGSSQLPSPSRNDASRLGENEGMSTQQTIPNPVGHPPFPNHLIGGENEGLRNLMISWYFAGYYTGFYEGQQQKQQR